MAKVRRGPYAWHNRELVIRDDACSPSVSTHGITQARASYERGRRKVALVERTAVNRQCTHSDSCTCGGEGGDVGIPDCVWPGPKKMREACAAASFERDRM